MEAKRSRTLRRVGILTSGGDAPGMNAAVRAAAALLSGRGVEPVGVYFGYRGLLREEIEPLTPAHVAHIIRDGGTILGSARCPEFMEPAGRQRAREILARHQIDGLIVIGGNGSLAGAAALTDPEEAGEEAISVMGVPASIDNDIGLTGLAIGVDTAMNTIVEACDKISDTASAFNRAFIVEVMGRDSGYLAMTAAVAAGADAVLFPESGRDEDEIVTSVVETIEAVLARQRRSRRALIIKAEGTRLSVDRLKALVDARMAATHGEDRPRVETRVTVLGHVVRGGRPSAFDRLLASRLTRVAVDALLAGRTREMAAWMVPMVPDAAKVVRSDSDPYCWLVELGAVLAETRRLLDGTSPLVQWRSRALDDVAPVLVL